MFASTTCRLSVNPFIIPDLEKKKSNQIIMSTREIVQNAVAAQQNTAASTLDAARTTDSPTVRDAGLTTPLQSASQDESLLSHKKHSKWTGHHNNAPAPSSWVVLKNLDYSMTQVALEEVVRRVTGGRMGFVNISLVDDRATGSFKGMAFVKFHSTQNAAAALSELSKMVINGRKVIAEYRRMRPGEIHEKWGKKFDYSNHKTAEKDISISPYVRGNGDKRAAFFASRENARMQNEHNPDDQSERYQEREVEFRNLLLEYGKRGLENDSVAKDLVFDSSLTPYERRMVHKISSELGLGHISRVDEIGSRVLHVTKDVNRIVEWEKEALEAKAEARKQVQEHRYKKIHSMDQRCYGISVSKEALQGINWFKPRSAGMTDGVQMGAIRPPRYKLYVPVRQPTGPDGTVGFSSRVGRGRGGDRENSDVDMMDVRVVELVGKGKASGHVMLNPSVPAFSPSLAPT